MLKQNCWEFKNCGREPGGIKVNEFGVCPAATELRVTGVHNGKYAGRVCWAITGTLCENKVQGSFASKLLSCLNCEFYKLVVKEEGKALLAAKIIIAKLKR